MGTIEKLETVATQMYLESAEDLAVSSPAFASSCGASSAAQEREKVGVFNAVLPGGKTIPLLKTMLTSACENDCYYCPFRAGRDYRRATFKPEEIAQTFVKMHRAGYVEGIFLSSGVVRGSVATQDKLLDAVDILRRKHEFGGYVHLKIMPGAERAQVERAMQLADRLSVNLEAPTTQRLRELAPKKQMLEGLLRPLQWIEDIRRARPAHDGWNRRWPSTTTQFVMGAVGETDLELLTATDYLYSRLRLRRAYYSPFSPIRDTPLENLPPASRVRESRLYQSSFLLRDYGFDVEELPFDGEGRLPLDTDPKLAWAEMNLAEAPVELNRANREQLLRVPGIGRIGANSIIKARRQGTLRYLSDLRKFGVRTKRLAPFVLLDGIRPVQQMRLF